MIDPIDGYEMDIDYGDMNRCEVCDEWGDDIRTCCYCKTKAHPDCDGGYMDREGEYVCAECVDAEAAYFGVRAREVGP